MHNDTLKLTAPAVIYHERRARLAASLTRPLVILAGRARIRNAGNALHFRAGSTYLYYGGPPIEGAAWIIEPDSKGDGGCTLLRPDVGPDEGVWTGATSVDSVLADATGIPSKNVTGCDALESLLNGRSGGYVCPSCCESLAWMTKAGLEPASADERSAIIQMRNIKDQHALAAMRHAAEAAVQAHLAAMKATAPGQNERDVAAALSASFVAADCHPSFEPIVTVRGDILHAPGYCRELAAGQLLLVDAGAEERGGYASDITRTYPVNGEFTGVQRHLYDTVLRALTEATAACIPGARYRDVHDLAARVICEGLVAAELLVGDAAELAGRGAHTLFFTQGIGHLIGLDVHDMEDFGDLAGYPPDRTRRPEFGSKFLRLDRDLEPGMTVTVEPGIYLSRAVWERDDLTAPFADLVNRSAVDALIADEFGGIRIEDTIHVLGSNVSGPEILTRDLPKDADSVASLVASG